MKKRLPLIIFAALYVLSLVAGFSFAALRQSPIDPEKNVQTRQENWILVRVDDITNDHPQLISVWAMFLTFSPGPQIYFKPIFSLNAKQNALSNLADLFTVTSDRSISGKFLQELDKLNIHRSGLVILDDLTFELTSGWLNSDLMARMESPFVPNTGSPSSQPQSPEYRSYENICASFTINNPRNQALPWQEIFPNHVLFQPGLKNLTDLWSRILAEPTDTHCEVVPAS